MCIVQYVQQQNMAPVIALSSLVTGLDDTVKYKYSILYCPLHLYYLTATFIRLAISTSCVLKDERRTNAAVSGFFTVRLSRI
jgi:hypothetical protein